MHTFFKPVYFLAQRTWNFLGQFGSILAILSWIYALWCTITGQNSAVVYQNWQISGMHTIKSWTKLNDLNVTTVCLVRIEVKRGRALCIMFQTSNLIFQQCISHPTKQTGDTCWAISLFSGKFINQRSNFLVIMEVLFKQYYWYIVLNILVGSINATTYIHIIS